MCVVLMPSTWRTTCWSVFWRKQLERFPQVSWLGAQTRAFCTLPMQATRRRLQDLTHLAAKCCTPQERGGTCRASCTRLATRAGVSTDAAGGADAGARSRPAPLRRLRATVRCRCDRNDAHDDDARLELAAKGQKMVILTILANMGLRGVERQPTSRRGCYWPCPSWWVVALVGTVRMCSGCAVFRGERFCSW